MTVKPFEPSPAGLRLELGRHYLAFGGRVQLIATVTEQGKTMLTFRMLTIDMPTVTISLVAWGELCYAGAICDA